jgi:metallo-beta-lactamase family protein
MKITFHGAARKVTGSRHLLTLPSGKNVLLDCGLFQGEGAETDTLNRHFGFNPQTVHALILSHAHADHAGNIPYLFNQGFNGPVYCTPGTLELCSVMLLDSANIQVKDIEYVNKKRRRRGQPQLTPLYTEEDVHRCLKNFIPVELNTETRITEDLLLLFTDAGHILGSAAVNLIVGGKTRIFFSGDTGRFHDLILKPPQPFPQADYIISESTYGDRLHESPGDASGKLLSVVMDTCVRKKGKVIIPAFSLGRTQEIIYTLDRLHTKGLMPRVKIYIDSPLSVNITGIMRKYVSQFNPEIIEYIKTDPDPFGYEDVRFISDVQQSKALNESNEPCIIVSASGMIEAGRIKHHVKNNIGDSRNTILIVGYCPPESVGGKLMRGERYVRIFGKEYEVHAAVEVISSYSAHADYKEIMHYLSCQNPVQVSRVFLVHGVIEAQEALRTRLMHAGFRDVVIPQMGESFKIE